MRFQRQKGKMRFICHPELKSGIGAWHFKGEEAGREAPGRER